MVRGLQHSKSPPDVSQGTQASCITASRELTLKILGIPLILAIFLGNREKLPELIWEKAAQQDLGASLRSQWVLT